MPIRAVDLKLTLSTTQERVLGENPLRTYALLVNDDSVNSIYLGMGIPAVANRGIPLIPKGNYEINLTNPWHGSIHAVSDAGTPALLIQEW